MRSRRAGSWRSGRAIPMLSDDGLTVLLTHPGDAQRTEVVHVEHLEDASEAPKLRRRWK